MKRFVLKGITLLAITALFPGRADAWFGFHYGYHYGPNGFHYGYRYGYGYGYGYYPPVLPVAVPVPVAVPTGPAAYSTDLSGFRVKPVVYKPGVFRAP